MISPASTEQPTWLERRTILRGVVGSTAHGLSVDDGQDDRDEMGIVVEPLSAMMGQSEFEQYIHRTAAVREGKHDARSGPGDLDLVLYSLRKWTRLALHGNPNVLMLLYLPSELKTIRVSLGSQLQELAPRFVSKEAGKRFLGYLSAQRQRLMGERGSKDVNRPELVEKYGFDTKYAMHMLRLGFQGVELLTTGKMTLPMKDGVRNYIRDVRLGKHELQQVLTRCGQLEAELKDLISGSDVPDHADAEAVWKWVRSTYLEHWKFEVARWSIADNRLREPSI